MVHRIMKQRQGKAGSKGSNIFVSTGIGDLTSLDSRDQKLTVCMINNPAILPAYLKLPICGPGMSVHSARPVLVLQVS